MSVRAVRCCLVPLAALVLNLDACGQGAVSATSREFFAAHPALQFVEQRLPREATLVIPPDPAQPRHVATDAELRAAFARVLDAFLAPPSTFASKTGELIDEVCRYRPAQIGQWIETAVDSILEHDLETAEQDLENAVAGAVAADPGEAGPTLARALRSLAAAVEETDHPLAISTAGKYAGNMVRAATRATAASPDAAGARRLILDAALREAIRLQARFLVIEIMAAAAQGHADRALVGDVCQGVLSKFGSTREWAGIICAGAMKGAGIESATTIKDSAAISLPVPFAAYAAVVCNAFVAMSSAQAPELAVVHFVLASNADFIPAAMIGAIVAQPAAASEILRAGLERDFILHGRATTRDILEAAIAACEASAPELAADAVGRGDLTEASAPAQIGEAIARAALPRHIGPALAAQIKAQGRQPEEIRATVAGAMAGAIAAKREASLSAIAFVAAAASGAAGEVIDQAIISAPPELQYACVLGALAADRDHGGVLLEQALHSPNLAPGQAAVIAAGAGVILETQRNPYAFFRAAVSRLSVAPGISAPAASAIVLGAALANPRGPAATTAAAVAATSIPPGSLVTVASRDDPHARKIIETTVGVTLRVKEDPAAVFRIVRDQIAAEPEAAPEIVTGAIVAAPRLGDVTAQAAAFAAPGAIGRIVPRLFAFSSAGNPAVHQHESAPGTLASLMDGVIRGITRADLDAAAGRGAISEAVAAAVKSVIAVSHDGATFASPRQAAAAFSAILTAATRAAPTDAAGIARTAARVARALTGKSADADALQAAVLAARPPVDAVKVADAVASGFAEAELQVPAPSVKMLLDYTRDSLTGPPMTPFRDL